ncbi:Hypothetical predicted protein [Lynx pardinus]|uniref:Uncharacterized protein n=1 Tax=Lynx pardinus TaxID=191816 RepID=A0A485MP75_LYNPA|nr:Hypothetical predicted protein [Lynx pardinus]
MYGASSPGPTRRFLPVLGPYKALPSRRVWQTARGRLWAGASGQGIRCQGGGGWRRWERAAWPLRGRAWLRNQQVLTGPSNSTSRDLNVVQSHGYSDLSAWR